MDESVAEPVAGGYWVVTIKEDLVTIKEELKEYERAKRAKLTRAAREKPQPPRKMYRVRETMRKLKPEHYDVEQISLGLYGRPPPGTKKTRADRCRLAMASAFLEEMGMHDDWDTVCKLVVSKPMDMEKLYDDDWKKEMLVPFSKENGLQRSNEERPKNFDNQVQCVLSVDAIFVACYFGTLFCEEFSTSFKSFKPAFEIASKVTLLSVITDLFKVENQIPLSLVYKVLEMLLKKVEDDQRNNPASEARERRAAGDILQDICMKLVLYMVDVIPGFDPDAKDNFEGINLSKCQNFLDCLYTFMCKKGEDSDSEYTSEAVVSSAGSTALIQTLPTVTALQKAGIQFEGRRGLFSDVVEFKQTSWFTAKLYLPTIAFGDNTESIWRNIVAYEDTQDIGQNFTVYLKLMDELIETPDDVIALKSRSGKALPVIYGDYLENSEAVARLFNNSVLQNTFVLGYEDKGRKLREDIKKFYNVEYRRTFWEFIDTYFGKIWLTISVIAATGLLIMTFLQTYYAIAGYYKNS